MREIVFAHSDVQYPSYTDYRSLVRVGGFESCPLSATAPGRTCTYIVSPVWSGEERAAISALAGAPGRHCGVVWWFLERAVLFGGAEFRWIAHNLLSTGVDEVWVSDRALYSKLRPHSEQFRFVPVGSDERLAEGAGAPEPNDVCLMAWMNPRRDAVVGALRCSIGQNAFGNERHRRLLGASLLLNIHQDGDPYFEPLRFALAAAYRLPVVSETCEDPFPYEPGVDFIAAPHGRLAAETMAALAADRGLLRGFGGRMFEKAAVKHRFSDNVKAAMEEFSDHHVFSGHF